MTHPYNGVSVALATKHHKERLILPAFSELNIALSVVDFDTDTLGTFSGEIERAVSAFETVKKKARIGIEKSGLPIGIASEGSFAQDPQIPLLHSNIELLAWIDTTRDLEIVESYRTFEIAALRQEIKPDDNLSTILCEAKFPSHALLVRTPGTEQRLIYKGLQDEESLRNALEKCWEIYPVAIIENDLRAHFNPTRQIAIRAVAEKLAARLKELCVECQSPGFGVIDLLKGLECSSCGQWNEQYPAGEILGCMKCNHRREARLAQRNIDPAHCNFCNP